MLTTDQKGAIAESSIAAAAIKLGIGVYKPLFEGGRYDLIFDTGSLVRVQCKWAVHHGEIVLVRCYSCRRATHGMITRTYCAREVDAIAAYCMELERTYLLPIELCAGHREIRLRLARSRNNQSIGINWASDYEFAARLGKPLGAVAQLGERLAGSQKATGSSPVSSTSHQPPDAASRIARMRSL